MKVITHTIIHQRKKMDIDIHSIMHPAKFAGRQIDSIMYPSNFAVGQIESIMYPANSAGGRSRLDLLLPSFLPSREEKKIQDRKNHPLGCRGVSHTPPKHLGRDEQKIQNRIFCPLRGHAVGRMQYAPTSCQQETLFPINSREERIETKMQERRKQSIDSGAEWHTPFMRQGERDAIWRDTFFETESACCHLARQALGGKIFTRKVSIEHFRRK